MITTLFVFFCIQVVIGCIADVAARQSSYYSRDEAYTILDPAHQVNQLLSIVAIAATITYWCVR